MRTALILLALSITACGAADPGPVQRSSAGGEAAQNQNAPPPTSSLDDVPAAPLGALAPGTDGADMERPISACGPADSYQRIAGFRCPDGSVPLHGDPEAGRRARTGSAGTNANGHLIDRYVVPCPEGDVDVYVDMYGCEEMQELMHGLSIP